MKTILLIDDDDNCRTPAAELLRRWEWNVVEAQDGEQGIELALEHRPDVILCDLLMPRGNGFRVCRTVRERSELKHTRVIVLTGRDFLTDREAAQEAGAHEYLVKPIDVARLEHALNRFSPPDETPQHIESSPRNSDTPVKIKFWGVRGSIPTPGPTTVHYGGNTSCIEVRADGELIVLDAGTGIRPLGHALAEEFGGQPIRLTLLISHTHWDHIQGFPFFLPAYNAQNHVRILGYEGARDGLAATLAGQMESPYFPIALKHMPGNIVIEELRDMKFKVGSVSVEACFCNHPGVCVGYRLSTSAGSIVYIPDNEWSVSQADAAKESVPSTMERNIVEFIRGADVLIIDAQYDHNEYEHHVGWGHGCLDDVVKLAVQSGSKQLYLFHHDPAHDDRFVSDLVVRARSLAQKLGSPLKIAAAREGEEVVLSSVTPRQS